MGTTMFGALDDLFATVVNPKDVGILIVGKVKGGASTDTLSIVVNDLGSWGCSQDCVGDVTSIPLSDSATILLGYADMPRSSLESKITLATSLAILAALATIVIFILLPCFILIFDQKKCNKHIKLTRTYDKISQNNEADFHSTRVYNPHWIPSTSGGDSTHYSSRSNPLLLYLWQIKLKNFIVSAKDKVLRVIKRQ
ncbi:hypothetical protein GOP47_0014811 [Adiantum capillus-veneris]|uniref:Uncharacterized protein n=1 Tax=Adiantum capillus-veneris TaxID=13818 RepID=A0A9D4UM77_ADICA|nr:hypothetical protein GOP47_0014811 [Adiantum capillus-veneris]